MFESCVRIIRFVLSPHLWGARKKKNLTPDPTPASLYEMLFLYTKKCLLLSDLDIIVQQNIHVNSFFQFLTRTYVCFVIDFIPVLCYTQKYTAER